MAKSGVGNHMKYWLGRALFMGGLFGSTPLTANLGKNSFDGIIIDYGNWPGYDPKTIYWANFSAPIEDPVGVISTTYNADIEWTRATGDWTEAVVSMTICDFGDITKILMGGDLVYSIANLKENQQIFMPAGNFTATLTFKTIA